MKKISWQEFTEKRFFLTLFVMFVSLVGGGVVAYFRPSLWLGWTLIGIGVFSFVVICVRQRQELKIQIGNVHDDRVAPKGKIETKDESMGFGVVALIVWYILLFFSVVGIAAAVIVYYALGPEMADKVAMISIGVGGGASVLFFIIALIASSKD
jgi:hypothetical protein